MAMFVLMGVKHGCELFRFAPIFENYFIKAVEHFFPCLHSLASTNTRKVGRILQIEKERNIMTSLHISNCEMFTFCDVLQETKRKTHRIQLTRKNKACAIPTTSRVTLISLKSSAVVAIQEYCPASDMCTSLMNRLPFAN